MAGAAFWNLGVLLGVGGIFAGDSTGYEWLEFPPYAAIVLFVAYLLVMSWAVLMFRFRRGGHDLHHAMVFARRVSLVPVALRRDANHAFRRPGAGRDAGRGQLVVREQSHVPLVRRDRTRHRLLHDPESDRASGLQLSSGGDRILDLRAIRQLDGHAATGRWTVSGLDDHGKHRGHDSYDHSSGNRWTESSHDDARIFPAHALQPDAALHRFWRDLVHGFQHGRCADFTPLRWRDMCTSPKRALPIRISVSTRFSRWSCLDRCITSCRDWSAANGVTRR